MSDIVKLLPESVANQIAAGEVVQRPASVVKELMENSVDAGATKIKLIIKDAGRLLIQVIDNGCGMSETDARMSFERHATSKLKNADDLFRINTFGFRGEALASIAAVAQVVMKTRRKEDEVGTAITIEGSKFVSQEMCTCDYGTSISVKNIFYNVPARRSFLKSNTQELKHIMEEFTKVALINPQISFSMYNNDSVVTELMSESFKQRIMNLVNKSYSDKIIPVEAATDTVRISGFIGKPEAAKKTKNTDQYFFVNGRYVKHPYLKHAIESTYQELIPADTYPMYFVKIDINPELIDVNIHPTKTEINFQDAHIIYAILKSAVKHSFGQYSMEVPSLDLDAEPSFIMTNADENRPIVQPKIKYDANYNPFNGLNNQRQPANEDWKSFYNEINTRFDHSQNEHITFGDKQTDNATLGDEPTGLFTDMGTEFIQSRNQYIIGTVKNGIIIIDQARADERIKYEKLVAQMEKGETAAQIDMFPETITLSYDESIILDESKDEFEKLGFKFGKMGQSNYVINAHPADITTDEIKSFFEDVLTNIKHEYSNKSVSRIKAIAKVTAKKTGLKSGKKLFVEEMRQIAQSLSQCSVKDTDLDGNPIYVIIDMDAVSKMFNN